jgi:hypothetical protein
MDSKHMESPIPTWRMTGETSWGRQYPAEALEKALVDSLSQPTVTPASGDVGAPRVPGTVAALGWPYLALWLAFALVSLYSAWRSFGAYDWW